MCSAGSGKKFYDLFWVATFMARRWARAWAIGQAIARRGAHGFGMRVIYHNHQQIGCANGVGMPTYVSKHDLAQQADHLILVLPYSARHHIVGAAEIALMKPSAMPYWSIGRGGLVDEKRIG